MTATATAAVAVVQTSRPDAGARRRVRVAAVAGAALLSSLLFLVARAFGTDFTITDPGVGKPPHTFVLPEITGISLFFALLGWAALAVLERYTTRAARVWGVLATTVLVLSMVPIGIERATPDTKLMLAVIHVAVAVALVPMIRHRASQPATSRD
jgi:hypothetical protein